MQEDLARLEELSTSALVERYAELFGEQTRTRHRAYLIRKIAWRMQANAEGDLSERARRRAEELANDADVRATPPKSERGQLTPTKLYVGAPADLRLPAPGTIIVRKYKGNTIRVHVVADGFEYEGEHYTSLSAVAKAITGTHCNGFRFFGLEAKQ
jgi:hypothetical protein